MITIPLTMLIVSSLVFFALSFSAGDSSSYVLSEEISESNVEDYREAQGMSDSLMLRYLDFLWSFIRGEFGQSAAGIEIATLLKQRLPVTLSISLLAFLLSLLIAVPLSYITLEKKSIGDILSTGWAALMASLPIFLLALFLVIVFSVWSGLFPVSGYSSLSAGFFKHLRSIFLPSLSIALLHSSFIMLMFRRALRESLEKPYSLIASAMGMSKHQRAIISATKPALPVLVAVLAQSFASFLGGSAAVETVFAIPGVGSLIVNASLSRDVMPSGTLLMIAALFVSIISFIAECLIYALDPRRRG